MEKKISTEKQRLCITCRKCCMEVGIYTHPDMYTCSEEETVHFYETRGFTVGKIEDLLVLTLKYPCPQLTTKGCAVYKERPQVCIDYSGLEDFGKDCFWSSIPVPKRRKKAGRKKT